MKHQLTALAILSITVIGTISAMDELSWPPTRQAARNFQQTEQPSPQYIPVVMPTHKEQELALQKAQFCAELLRMHNNNVPAFDVTKATREHSRIFLEAYTSNLSADGFNTAEQIRVYRQSDNQ